MRQIQKNDPPAALVEHRKKEHADYDNYPEKDELRLSLCNEQRGICCYCMSYIRADVNYMKIEHHQCQDEYPERQLDYPNMLGACKGNEGAERKFTHCDTYKGNSTLTIYPPNPMVAIHDQMIYGNDGAVTSGNQQYAVEIENVLNLNAAILKRNRKAALDGFKDYVGKSYSKKQPQKATIVKWIDHWSGVSHADNLNPYCMVIVYWLKRRLNRA